MTKHKTQPATSKQSTCKRKKTTKSDLPKSSEAANTNHSSNTPLLDFEKENNKTVAILPSPEHAKELQSLSDTENTESISDFGLQTFNSVNLSITKNKDLEDFATVEGDLPPFLKLDLFSNKYIFLSSEFDFDTIITQRRLNEEEFIKTLDWSLFNRLVTNLMALFYSKLSEYFKSVLSSKFRHEFCAILSSKLPVMEKKYHLLREEASKQTSHSFSLTAQKLTSFSDLLYTRFETHYRKKLQKTAKEQGVALPVLKGNGAKVAESNKKRKK